MQVFCVDNVPPQLVRTFVELCRTGDSEIDNLALVTDIRGDIFNEQFQSALSSFKNNNNGVEILFLEALKTLVTRYQTTRRKHPLTDRAESLACNPLRWSGKSLPPFGMKPIISSIPRG